MGRKADLHSGPSLGVSLGDPLKVQCRLVEVRDNRGLYQELGGMLSQIRPGFSQKTKVAQPGGVTRPEKDSWSSIMTPRFLATFVRMRDEEVIFFMFIL